MSVSINIGNGNYYPHKIAPPPRQSLSRKWQRLTRLQKSIVYVISVGVLILIIYKTTNHDIPSDVTPHPRRIVKPPSHNSAHRSNDESAEDVAKEDVAEKVIDTGAIEVKDKEVNDAREVEWDKADHIQAAAADYDNDHIPDSNEDDDGHDDAGSDGRGMFDGPSNDRQNAVVSAVKHSWTAYKAHAWGKDQLKPISKTSHTWFDLGLTIIDSLDTLYIMGLTAEYNEAREWVKDSLSYEKGDVNLFETTIRVLGGLLSTYHLSGDELFLAKAKALGDRLMPAFQTKSGVPYSDVNIRSGKSHAPKWGPDSSTSEVTTIQLEFNDLSYVTGEDKYKEAVAKVRQVIHDQQKKDGLIPIFINAQTGKLRDTATITLGARGDSYYEYLLKEWIQTGKHNDMLRSDYIEAMSGVTKHLVRQSKPSNLYYIGELLNGRKFSPKMDHLVAFISGTLALGAHHGMPSEHLQLAKDLLYTFNQMYVQMPSGLSPEIAFFSTADNSNEDIIVKKADAHNLLRPETVESLYYLYWLTGDKKYQDWGWDIFQSFEKHARISSGGYCSLSNVKLAEPSCRDDMESFWLGETLKYFYLLFADKNLLPFDKWVINTEAHVFPIQKH